MKKLKPIGIVWHACPICHKMHKKIGVCDICIVQNFPTSMSASMIRFGWAAKDLFTTIKKEVFFWKR